MHNLTNHGKILSYENMPKSWKKEIRQTSVFFKKKTMTNIFTSDWFSLLILKRITWEGVERVWLYHPVLTLTTQIYQGCLNGIYRNQIMEKRRPIHLTSLTVGKIHCFYYWQTSLSRSAVLKFSISRLHDILKLCVSINIYHLIKWEIC